MFPFQVKRIQPKVSNKIEYGSYMVWKYHLPKYIQNIQTSAKILLQQLTTFSLQKHKTNHLKFDKIIACF